jgi:hypothetical protein
VALDSTYEFRTVQLTTLTAAVTLVVKCFLAVTYVFARRWSSIIWLRYAACLNLDRLYCGLSLGLGLQ